MKKLSITILIAAFVFQAFSQEKSLTETKCETKSDIRRNNENLLHPSSKQVEFEQKMLEAKNSGDVNGMMNIQRKLDELTGASVTKPVEHIDAKITQGGGGMMQGDSISLSAISTDPNVTSVSTCTEQRGANIGRVWAIMVFAGAQNVMRFSYSDNNGISWTPYGSFTYNTGINISSDDIDAELVENTTGSKYIWVVFGYRNGLDWRIVGSVMNITSFAANTFYLTWPGFSNGDYYYKPRICSDNAHFDNLPWIYIICDYDSATATGYNSGAKVASCLSPYTINPTITYRGDCILGTSVYKRLYFYDITYFQNGSLDSIAIVESSLVDSNTIFIGATSIGGFTQSTRYTGYIQNNGEVKNNAYIASNGNYNQLMIVCREKYSANLWDVTYYKSSNGSSGWVRNYVDGRYVNKSRPDIVGKRNVGGIFYCTYSTLDSYDSVFNASSINYSFGSAVGPKNHVGSTSVALPRPGLLLSTGENCFSIWSATGGNGVWGSRGCSPVVIGILKNSNSVPDKFELKQNYPNPFNPTTIINFDLPKAGLVNLVVYDILGRTVETLVNENKEAGSYKVDFNATNLSSGVYFYRIDAGGFSSVKKMLLVK